MYGLRQLAQNKDLSLAEVRTEMWFGAVEEETWLNLHVTGICTHSYRSQCKQLGSEMLIFACFVEYTDVPMT